MENDELFDIEEGFDAGEWNNVKPCPKCQGSGFSGRGTGYDDVCSECGGLRYFPDDGKDSKFAAQ